MNQPFRVPGALVLDSQGLSKLIDGDPLVTRLHQDARGYIAGTVISTVTLVEAQHAGMRQSQVNYTLSGLNAIAADLKIVKHARQLLFESGRHGHQHAIDAIVAATAIAQTGPVVLLTSDPDDMATLCDKRVLIREI